MCKRKATSLEPTPVIETLEDLIEYATEIKINPIRILRSNKNMKKLPLIIEDLVELNNMTGLTKLKSQVLYQILYYLENNENLLMHTVIEGPPGSGKTTVARIMGVIYSKLGILKKQKFKLLSRADLIGEYLGETTQKTLKALNSCRHGVAFIDEAYSLGSQERTDIYSKEAIDTINQFLLENQDDFICIIAGYKQELEDCFFSKNPGLRRRFPWRFKIDPCDCESLKSIFYNKIDWDIESLDKTEIDALFSKHKNLMTNNGGDIDIIIQYAKIHAVKRNFGKKIRNIIIQDLNYAFEQLKETRTGVDNPPPFGMYT